MKSTSAYRFSDFNKGLIKKPTDVRNRLLNQANCSLQGGSFDTRHLDKFIKSRDPAYMAYTQDTFNSGVIEMNFDSATAPAVVVQENPSPQDSQ